MVGTPANFVVMSSNINHHPEFQNQHRVPAVYLKKFSFRDKGARYVSVIEKGKDRTDRKRISEFTAEVNIFDYPIPEMEWKRHFEKTCARVETEYDRLLDGIHKTRKLSELHREILCEFVTSLMCRSRYNQDFYRSLLIHHETKTKFVDEITLFDKEKKDSLYTILHLSEVEESFMVFVGQVAAHLSRCLRSFKCVVLKSPTKEGGAWPTSDNPVVMDDQGSHGSILPVEAEIYLPLSRDYCLFMYHEGSQERDHPLRGLEKNSVHDSDLASHAYVCWHVTRNADRFIILPRKLEYIFRNNSLSFIPPRKIVLH